MACPCSRGDWAARHAVSGRHVFRYQGIRENTWWVWVCKYCTHEIKSKDPSGILGRKDTTCPARQRQGARGQT